MKFLPLSAARPMELAHQRAWIVFLARASLLTRSMVGIFIGVMLVPTCPSTARAGDVPIASCVADGGNCTGISPYSGPTTASWEAAAHQGATRYAAAHSPGACPCDGTVCSTLNSWALISKVGPGFSNANTVTGQTTLSAVNTANFPWNVPSNSPISSPTCSCPTNAHFSPDGVCQCNAGTIWDGTQCIAPSACTSVSKLFLDLCSPAAVLPKNRGQACTSNPCNPGTGLKVQRETFYSSGLLEFKGVYNSNPPGTPLPYQPNVLGKEWTFNYGSRISVLSGGKMAMTRPSGQMFEFRPPTSGLVYQSDADVSDRFERLVNGQSATIGWRYTVASTDAVEMYSPTGALLSITSRNGQSVTLTYSDANTPTTVAFNPGLVIRATDSFGRTLLFAYDQLNRIRQFTDPLGGIYTLKYDESSAIVQAGQAAIGNFTSITYPDGFKKTYHYNEQSYTANTNLASALTGISDEANVRYSIYKYDSVGRVVSSEHAGNAERYQFNYDVSFQQTTVTDPLGQSRGYFYVIGQGMVRPSGISSPCANCEATSSQSYDTNGNFSSKTDFNGNVTTYAYDLSRNLETSRTEASGTARARTITTTWDTVFRLPHVVSTYAGGAATGTPVQTTTYNYDTSGNLLTRTITDPVLNVSRTWTYTYNSLGQVLTVDGPRTDVNDVTTYTYNNCATGNECGQLHTIMDAAGHVTTFNTYNAAGQPLTITDANGILTTLTYDNRQRLKSRMIAGETTSFDYYPTGLLQKVTLPDGSFLQYAYDDAHRLTQVQDADGNRIVYAVDAMGNRTAEQAYDPSNAIARTHTRVFNSLNQLYQDINAGNTAAVTTTFAYDNNGNQTTINAPMSRNSINGYDELNRLNQFTDPALGITHYGYDSQDNLTSVQDPRGLSTTYFYNGLGDLTQQVSPDTATTTNTFDSGGNLKTSIDARSQSVTYNYDVLNRVTQAVYSDQTFNYLYDTGTNGVGRLDQITDASGSTGYAYTSVGRIASKTQVIGSQTKSIGYGYNAAGQLTTVTTPSGQTITLGYTHNRVTSLSVNGTAVLSQATYSPFGPITGWTWGNGTTTTRSFDQDGYFTGNQSAGSSTYTYYPDGSIATRIDDSSANLGLTAGTTTSVVSPTSNRLASTSGVLTHAYYYDLAGNITDDGARSFSYNGAGRMATAMSNSVTTTYLYNALGQRVKKSNATQTTYFVYDEAGHLMGEYDQAGTLIQELVWLGDIPVATIRTDQGGSGVGVFYIHTDHLNAPSKITRPSDNAIIWRWDHDPFGNGAANEDPDGNGLALNFNLRFPGQYFDSETGMNYNYFRDYDPSTGRYAESDPIGLGGGVNTYSYVLSAPLTQSDHLGLVTTSCGKRCGVMKGPEYNVSGSVPAGTTLTFNATFRRDNTHDPSCCAVRQWIKWNKPPFPGQSAPHSGFAPPENQPGNWYEDRSSSGDRYGHAGTDPYADLDSSNGYDSSGYHGWDRPGGANPPSIPGFKMSFRLSVIDVCNGGITVYTSKTLDVLF